MRDEGAPQPSSAMDDLPGPRARKRAYQRTASSPEEAGAPRPRSTPVPAW